MLLISRSLRIPITSFPRTRIAIAVTTSQFRHLSYPSSTMPPSPPPPPPNTAATKPPSPSPPANPKPQSPLRLSSSLLLLSPTNQILLVQRSHSKSMSFSSAIVFPGGNLDSTHDSFLLPSTSPQLPLPKTLPLSSNLLDTPEDLETALKTCAIRETFEETGVILAHPTSINSSSTSTGVDADTLRSARQTLLNRDNQKPFSQVLKDLQLRITPEELHPFTTWITPPNIPKRYRASMFLAFLPIDSPPIELDPPLSIPDEAGGSGGGGGGEIAQARWIHPRNLLNLYHAQSKAPSPSSSASKKPRLILFPPQYFLLTHLAHSIERNPSSAQAARDHLLYFTGYEYFSRQVIQPYTKKVLGEEEGKDKGKVLLGIDRPRGDMNQWIKVKFGKDGPSEVELVKRLKDGKETVEEGRGENNKAKL